MNPTPSNRRLAAIGTTPRRRRLIKATVVVAWVAVIVAVLSLAWSWLDQPSGQELNRLAWEASFRERSLPVPPDGPRDGYWGAGIPNQVRHPVLGWREAEAFIPGRVESDAAGIQRAGSSAPDAKRILIVGASVAWGAYASSIDTTYFDLLADRLSETVGPVQIIVLAAGAWESENELTAWRQYGLPLSPNLVLFLNGLNDVTHAAAPRRKRRGQAVTPREERVRRYLDNMHAAKELAVEHGVTIVFAPQPFLPDKQRKSRLERRILDLTLDSELPADYVEQSYRTLRGGLASLADDHEAYLADVSDVFDAETATTFTDIWHFADPGHALLADALADELGPILAAR